MGVMRWRGMPCLWMILLWVDFCRCAVFSCVVFPPQSGLATCGGECERRLFLEFKISRFPSVKKFAPKPILERVYPSNLNAWRSMGLAHMPHHECGCVGGKIGDKNCVRFLHSRVIPPRSTKLQSAPQRSECRWCRFPRTLGRYQSH